MSIDSTLERLRAAIPSGGFESQPQAQGVVTRMVGMSLEAVGLRVSVGQLCRVSGPGIAFDAEVVGFAEDRVFLMPTTQVAGLSPGAKVVPLRHASQVPVGFGLLGRVINANGEPLDGKGPLRVDRYVDMAGTVINPMQRKPIREPLDVGVRSINSMLTVGRGQRMGLFAGSGVGKSMLLGMMTRFTEAEVVVVGLVGERGREVKEFIDEILGEEGLQRAVVIASPADDAPLMRLRAPVLATRIAEYFRDEGLNVLLLMDSLTRYAQAQREIALSIGEPPATKGYPPSVFAKIPQLVERAGNSSSETGSLTAFYTVLSEGDDMQDPVADASRAILDGHIVLSRALAEEGHYPAIDIEASISRVMPAIVSEQHLRTAQRFRQLYARYQQARDLISVGAYVTGSDRETDFAIEKMPTFREFLRQGLRESVNFEQAVAQLYQVLGLAEAPPSASS